MASKSKAKPMRVWVVVDKTNCPQTAWLTERHAKDDAKADDEKYKGMGFAPHRVVEFVSVTPRKRQKGKSK